MRIPSYAFAALLFPLALPAIIQQQGRSAPAGQNGSYTLTANPKLVVLDVVVRDKQGNLVTNLKKEDFELQEDRQLQRIFSFEAPAVHALPPNVVIHSTEELDRLAPNAPATIIVLDEYVSNFGDMYTARYAIQRYLKAQPQLLAQPTMLVTVNVDKLIVLHDYTQDRDAILTTLNHHNAGRADYSGSESRNGLAFMGFQVMAGYRSLAQLAQSTAGHPGHKNVIWVGRGLPANLTLHGEQALKLHVELQKLIDMLVASRVTLSTIDLKGVQWVDLKNPISDGINGIDDSVVSFAEVANATGGTRIYQRNDMDAGIATIVHDDSEFYTLSYIPTSGSDAKGAFRKIHIVMKDPDLRASTRTGYYPNPEREPGWQIVDNKPGKPMRQDPKNLIDKTLVDTKLVYDGIPLLLARTDTPGQVVVQMDGKALSWMDHGPSQPRTAKVKISCISFDKKDQILDLEGTDTEATLPATALATPQDANVRFSLNCDADPRAVRLRVVIQASDPIKIGAANLDLAAK